MDTEDRQHGSKYSMKEDEKMIYRLNLRSEGRTELKYELKELFAFLSCLNPSKITKCIFGNNVLK